MYVYNIYTSGMMARNEDVLSWNRNEGGTISGVTVYCRRPAVS